MSFTHINIIGYGFVGSSVGYLCQQNHITYHIYDSKYNYNLLENFCSSLYKLIKTSEKTNTDNFYFIAVPTPSDNEGNCDTSIVENVLKELAETCDPEKNTYILIKSTLVPGTCQRFCEMFPSLHIIFCPEFLREVTAKDDIYNAEFVLCSFKNPEINTKIETLFRLLYKHNQKIDIIFKSYEECEMFKYTLNVYFAVKVWYFNEIYEICEKMKIDYQSLKSLFKLDKRVGEYGTTVPGDDGFGFSKSCLPKEIKGMMKLQENKIIPNDVLKNIIDRNLFFRSKK